MDLTPWIPVIVEITRFTLDHINSLVVSGRASAQEATSNTDKIEMILPELASANLPKLAKKFNQSVTLDSLRAVQNKYQRAKNIQRQVEIKEVAYSGLVDQAGPQALQLQFDIQRLQEDQLFPLIKELKEDLNHILA